ncbi:ABC-type glycerol-3-phosphate transport system, substrate-binding protein [Paenibacillus sp. UNCCL117]|uniref:extracellular solute-binding protein n=1 Tax=unclassified Paenibacillus TaxID=185978 RepID=UPI00089189ED|nr:MULTISPECIES: extracellular solute-binding protein [unclassified Paenibacillus]SDE11870.1 ABC-type glycerol-3-phosphate transport system, substrate-binding protein [Paenibacillus sp. cl123]SFW60068.1 ABC-type glycerol-3-phosphate transport system, substrate-binding protein [Paenibacillus sp. UNCCL117]
MKLKTLQWTKRSMAVLLTSSIVLSACENEETVQEPSNSAKPTATTGTTQTNQFKDKLTLNWFVPAPSNSSLPTDDTDFVRKRIEEKFNVDLKVTYMVAGNDYNSKINVLLASTPPDMWRDNTPDGGQKYAIDGLLADLTRFVTPVTMPNYFKYWTSEEEVKRYRTNNQYVRAPLPRPKRTYRSWYVRKDWLDKLGLKMPNNYDEYVNMLKQFTFNDPDGNGKQDTYGFTTSGNGANLGYDWPEFVKNDLPFPSFIENNQYADSSMHPKMEQVLNDVVKLMNDKVIDPDWFLNKAPQHIEKAIQGKVGVVLSGAKNFAYDNNTQGIQYRTKQINSQAEWQPMPIFANKAIGSKSAPGSPILFPKTVADKNPERIERTTAILDWLASEEGYLLTHYGVEGKHYTRDGNIIKLNVEAYTNDVTKKGDFLSIWNFFTSDVSQPEVYNMELIDGRETDRDRNIAKVLNAIPLNDYIGAPLVAPLGFDLPAFRKRQNELFAKAIFEDKSGKNWPQYREELLTKYKGKELFDAYNQNLRDAGVIK